MQHDTEPVVYLPSFDAIDGRRREFHASAYDGVFRSDDDDGVYASVCSPLVKLAQRGETGCLLAYGQTGTGKTYNIWQVALPSITSALFASSWVTVRVAVVQLHLDTLSDLLAPKQRPPNGVRAEGAPPLRMPQPTRGAVDPVGLHWVCCSSHSEVLAAFARARTRRHMGPTALNKASSRSHTILYLEVVADEADGADDDWSISTPTTTTLSSVAASCSTSGSKASLPSTSSSVSHAHDLAPTIVSASTAATPGSAAGSIGSSRASNCRSSRTWSRAATVAAMSGVGGRIVVVDLAGSERLKKSGSSGASQKEAIAINTSLHALSQTVRALAEQARHLPTRESKLTQLLDAYIRGGSLLHLLVVSAGHRRLLPCCCPR